MIERRCLYRLFDFLRALFVERNDSAEPAFPAELRRQHGVIGKRRSGLLDKQVERFGKLLPPYLDQQMKSGHPVSASEKSTTSRRRQSGEGLPHWRFCSLSSNLRPHWLRAVPSGVSISKNNRVSDDCPGGRKLTRR